MHKKKILEKDKQILFRNWQKSQLIKNKAVLQAFQSVNRELFVDSSYQDLSYSDQPLPIGSGQTISQPTTVAIMLQLLNVLPEHRILSVASRTNARKFGVGESKPGWQSCRGRTKPPWTRYAVGS